MIIIPAINCFDFNCVKEKLQKVADFTSLKAGWVQIDVADGKFTNWKTWDNSEELKLLIDTNKRLIGTNHKLNIEIHLMAENPLEIADDWIKAGAKRIILHIEALERLWTSDVQQLNIHNIWDIGRPKRKDCEIGIAINPDTPIEKLGFFLKLTTNNQQPITNFVQLLAVSPGKSGQKFDERILEKIKFLKKNHPDVIIEVDGGINLETAKMCKKAGADILAVGSYMWGSENPEKVYNMLCNI